LAHYRSIFISDLHLGTRGCQAKAINNFLKNNTCETLFLVGDILDGWRLKKNWYFPQSHANVIRRFFTIAKNGTRVVYIAGNHDEMLRPLIPMGICFGKIEVVNKFDYLGVNGKRYLVVHGDMFDNIMLDKKWLMHFGDTIYDMLIWSNTKLNIVRNWLGRDYWSLSKWLKHNTKQALNFIYKFEEQVAAYCKRKGYDGIICGHIHTAVIKDIDGIEYMNDGDFVESCTALVEHEDGTWEILDASEKNNEV
jgi:UDP-2,3-diacylglucosamine pyrophosphatase LpxH